MDILTENQKIILRKDLENTVNFYLSQIKYCKTNEYKFEFRGQLCVYFKLGVLTENEFSVYEKFIGDD